MNVILSNIWVPSESLHIILHHYKANNSVLSCMRSCILGSGAQRLGKLEKEGCQFEFSLLMALNGHVTCDVWREKHNCKSQMLSKKIMTSEFLRNLSEKHYQFIRRNWISWYQNKWFHWRMLSRSELLRSVIDLRSENGEIHKKKVLAYQLLRIPF